MGKYRSLKILLHVHVLTLEQDEAQAHMQSSEKSTFMFSIISINVLDTLQPP